MSTRRKNTHSGSGIGFTIVELLIVIVVIGILAAIVIVAYTGVQGRARDSQRLSDMKTIMKALEIYKLNNGVYPSPNQTPNGGGWEVSTNGTTATNFLSALVSNNGVSKIPVDPTNTGNPANLNPGWSVNEYEYFYYLYPAGTNSCDPTRGQFYVLGVTRMDGVASGTSSPSSPGWVCSGGNWFGYGAWVTGSFTN
jgi:general secretion pathway protein G